VWCFWLKAALFVTNHLDVSPLFSAIEVSVERLARPKDDLFENSTMTFGEHLEELRQSLVKAILWLCGGLAIGLFFADRVILFVQSPLQEAIQDFNVDRDLHRLGYEDPKAPELQPLRRFLSTNSLIWEIVYDIPEELQTLTMDSLDDPQADKETQAEKTIKPVEMAEMLRKLPDPTTLKPKIQLRENKTSLSALKIEEPFMIWIKAGLVVGAVLASPMILHSLWTFVAAGLHAHERRYVYVYLPVSVTLFVSGVVLAFFLVLHYVLTFLLSFNGAMDVAVEPRLTYYINFILMLPLGFGIAFQLPLVMLFFQRIGLIETEAYISSWRVAVLVIFIVAVLMTPADVTSMFAMAIPLLFLYALGILMCKYIPRGRGLGSDAYDPA
jgi:sec-independent protein translocase protein TatC